MRIYILGRLEKSIRYDEVMEIVVRASSEEEARKLASPKGMDEGKDIWLDPKKTSCDPVPLLLSKAEVICVSAING